MAPLCEVAEAGTEAQAEPLGNARPALISHIAPAPDRRFPAPKLESSLTLVLRLSASFALLIGGLLALGCWVSHRALTADLRLQDELSKRAAKLQLAHQALLLSSANSRIVMQVLAQKGAAPDLLARRAENSKRILAVINAFEQQCDSDKEKELLLAVKQARLPYVNSYMRALQILTEEKNEAQAQAIMFKEASPALLAYRTAWNDLATFELEQVTGAAEQRTRHDHRTRSIGLLLQSLAALLAAVIAVFTTSGMARDLKLRIRMHARLMALNTKLEQRVRKRTQELVRAEQQLRESLAETQEYAGETEAVNDLTQLLQSCLTLEEAHQQASRVLQKFFPSGAILMMNASRNLLEVALTWGEAASREGPFPPESCWALRKGQIHLTRPHCLNPACTHYHNATPRCHVCIPMIAQGGSLGILSIDDPGLCDGESMSHRLQRKLKLANTLAQHISLAFANLNLRETLGYQSVRDPLTGLFNRRHMEESLQRELRRAARKGTPAAVLMIDVDHFKRFNDTFGHGAGDLVLREFGLLLRLQIRGGDIACRYGGEEFLLIMGETDADNARQRAEALRTRVAALPIRYRGQTLQQLTISIGVAVFPANAGSAAELISAADSALYRAKHEGRNRVVVAE